MDSCTELRRGPWSLLSNTKHQNQTAKQKQTPPLDTLCCRLRHWEPHQPHRLPGCSLKPALLPCTVTRVAAGVPRHRGRSNWPHTWTGSRSFPLTYLANEEKWVPLRFSSCCGTFVLVLHPCVIGKAAVRTKPPSFVPSLHMRAYKALTVKNGLLCAAEVHNVPALIGIDCRRNQINKIFKAFTL